MGYGHWQSYAAVFAGLYSGELWLLHVPQGEAGRPLIHQKGVGIRPHPSLFLEVIMLSFFADCVRLFGATFDAAFELDFFRFLGGFSIVWMCIGFYLYLMRGFKRM